MALTVLINKKTSLKSSCEKDYTINYAAIYCLETHQGTNFNYRAGVGNFSG